MRPAHDPVPGHPRGAGRTPEPDGDTGAHHRPDRRRPALSGAGGGAGPSIGVHHPTGAPGPGARRPRRPLGVMVVDAYRHHQRPQGDSGGRQDHAWSARRRGSGAAPPGRLGPRHGRCAYPGAGGRQDQRDPRAQGAAQAPRPRRGSGEHRRHGAPRWTPPSGSPSVAVTTCSRLWAIRRPCAGRSRSCPGRMSRPHPGVTSLTGGECGAPSKRSRLPPGWTSPERLR